MWIVQVVGHTTTIRASSVEAMQVAVWYVTEMGFDCVVDFEEDTSCVTATVSIDSLATAGSKRSTSASSDEG